MRRALIEASEILSLVAGNGVVKKAVSDTVDGAVRGAQRAAVTLDSASTHDEA